MNEGHMFSPNVAHQVHATYTRVRRLPTDGGEARFFQNLVPGVPFAERHEKT